MKEIASRAMKIGKKGLKGMKKIMDTMLDNLEKGQQVNYMGEVWNAKKGKAWNENIRKGTPQNNLK